MPLPETSPYRNTKLVARQFQKVVIVSAHFARRAAESAIIQAGNRREMLRKEMFLHFPRDFQFAIQALPAAISRLMVVR